MKEEQNIIDRFGREHPWRVPEGYFESVRIEIESKLPAYPEMPKPQKLTVWQRVRPYMYLAAMFAGIWMMMKVLHTASGGDGMSLDNMPDQIAQYIGEPEVMDPYLLPATLSDAELIDVVSSNYDSMEDFEEDFDYDLKPEYEDIEVMD